MSDLQDVSILKGSVHRKSTWAFNMTVSDLHLKKSADV